MIKALGFLAVFLCSINALAITVTDSRGEHHFERVPERVVTLSWSIVESLIELGITPLAMADIDGYKKWVVRPALPETVIDIGTREEPNIERLAELRPDVIIISNGQSDLIGKLEKVAPVLFFDAFNKDHNNYQASRQIFLELAVLFHRVALANGRVASMEARFAELKAALLRHFGGELPKVTCVRFNTTAVLWVYGDNSMPHYALEALGLEPAFPQPATQWGVVQKKLTDLAQIRDGIVLSIEPFDQAEALFSAPLWKAMPFVRANRFASVRSTWTYGGPLSIQYLAESITEALLTIKP